MTTLTSHVVALASYQLAQFSLLVMSIPYQTMSSLTVGLPSLDFLPQQRILPQVPSPSTKMPANLEPNFSRVQAGGKHIHKFASWSQSVIGSSWVPVLWKQSFPHTRQVWLFATQGLYGVPQAACYAHQHIAEALP